jgi:adenylate kinase family enzyme
LASAVVRVSVVGNSGSGKSTVARRLAAGLGVDHLELDSIFHQPRWRPVPAPEFHRRVADFVAAEGWVIDGNYSAVLPIVWARAQAVVWLDLSRPLVMAQRVRRTVPRVVLRREPWDGSRESLPNLLRRNDANIVHLAWTNHRKDHDRHAAAPVSPAYAHIRLVRVTSRLDVDSVLARLR